MKRIAVCMFVVFVTCVSVPLGHVFAQEDDEEAEKSEAGVVPAKPSKPKQRRKPVPIQDAPDADQGSATKASKPKQPKAKATLMKEKTKVFLFLSPILSKPNKANDAAAFGTIILKLAQSRLNQLEAVKLKTYKAMPQVTNVMARYGNLEKLDRVSLIAIKNITGFDGLIQTSYELVNTGVVLTMTYVDFRNGKVFRKRKIRASLSASVFKTIENDMIEFATLIRRSYRVTLQIKSRPEGADVRINGKTIGKTPLLRELRTGEHLIEVAASGYETYATSMFLKAGDKLKLRAVLPKSLVSFVITSKPKGSKVYIDGSYRGKTPLRGTATVGKHQVRVSNSGYKEYNTTVNLNPGDRFQLHAPLYNPLAARFLNAKPGFRLDSRQLHFGYRYVFLGIDLPNFRDVNFIDMSFLMRIKWFEVGFRFSPSVGVSSSNKLDTFVGDGEGVQNFDINLIQVHAVFKWAMFEKYSFASLHLGASLGLTLSQVSSGGTEEDFRGSFSAEGFLSFVSRLARGGNFSLELQFDAGFAYLGQLQYKERQFSLFGQAKEVEMSKPMYGPFGALTLRLVFWNGIF
ncbi:MAG: PEGA domain-containing protein [Deltaproteobacteria bacterium]|nr:MAG: PEGA domain-containing protein [Deltaproteobacteria bacterium]